MIPSIQKYFFDQLMMDFVNKLKLSDQTYQTNGNVRNGNYKGKFLFATEYFVSLVISTVFSKYNVDGVCVPHFHLAYICDTTHPSFKVFVKVCCEVHHMRWGNQYLKLQEWEDCIKSDKTIILAIFLFFFRSGHRGPKAYSLLGGVVPSQSIG